MISNLDHDSGLLAGLLLLVLAHHTLVYIARLLLYLHRSPNPVICLEKNQTMSPQP